MPFAEAFVRACARRDAIVATGTTSAYRLLDGAGDGVPGVYVDRYGPAAVLGVLHYWWHKAGKADIAEPALYALALAVLLGWRIVARLRRASG